MSDITIFKARKILTMIPNRPEATHVAVREGRILGAGSLEDLAGWGAYALDERFADKVLMPGFVEGHAHTMEGSAWNRVYCGWFDRMDPDGKVWSGLKSVDAVLDRLRAAEAALSDPAAPLAGWQFDPLYMPGAVFSRHELDRVSTTRPVAVLHASGHILVANSVALEMAGLLREGINHQSYPLGEDGLPTGILLGPEARLAIARHVGMAEAIATNAESDLRAFSRLCVRTGTTTITDLAAQLPEPGVVSMVAVTQQPDWPVRLVPFRTFLGMKPEALIAEVQRLAGLSHDKLRLGGIKIHVDGSIQGFTARLRWPGYFNGAPNGLWYIAPEHLAEILERALAARVPVHMHTNGDQATQLVLETLEVALQKHPSPDHRFTLQHCQLADAAQLRQAARLGMCVNLFANHIYYWGEQHYAQTVGPERARRMNACRTALDAGAPLAIHCDAPVTPLGPLFTAWCAVNRISSEGRVLGPEECITVHEALRAITLGAAHTLHLDGELGSIETGKRADFAVLEEDPTAVAPEALKDVRVWGTVLGGVAFQAGTV